MATWVEVPLGRDHEWVGAFRFVTQNGTPVVAEVRVFPNAETPRKLGEAPRGDDAVPAGGLTRTFLQSEVAFSEALSTYAAATEDFVSRYGKPAEAALKRTRTSRKRPRRGGPKVEDIEWLHRYLVPLDRWVKLVNQNPPHPSATAEIARKHPSFAHLLTTARRRGLITPAMPGRASGRFTPKAEALIRQIGREKGRKR